MLKIILLFVLSISFIACQSSAVVVKTDNAGPSKKYDESFDPNSLDDDDIVIAGVPKTEDVKAGPQDEKNTDIEYKEVNGYRVQIIVTKNIESATLVEEEAREHFKNDGYKTYLVFEGPLYKVRIGDARNRAEAEKIRDLARDLNYRDAYIVPSKVNVINNGD